MQDNYFTLCQVARILGKKPHLVVYAITSGHVPEPGLRIGNKRVFNREDVERLARHLRIATPGSIPKKRGTRVRPIAPRACPSPARSLSIKQARAASRSGTGMARCSAGPSIGPAP
jgi:hypothetical protein